MQLLLTGGGSRLHKGKVKKRRRGEKEREREREREREEEEDEGEEGKKEKKAWVGIAGFSRFQSDVRFYPRPSSMV